VGLWNSFCGQTPDLNARKNPVQLLRFILQLDTINLQMIVKPSPQAAANFVNVHTESSRRADAFPTSGEEGFEQVTMPVTKMRELEARAAGSDSAIEACRLEYERSRTGGVNGPAYKWCKAAGVTDEELEYRHANHLCYFCNEYVRNNGIIVHTFWHCPKRLLVHDEIQAKIDASRGPTQRSSNDRRMEKGSAREDADQDQSFPRREFRDPGSNRGYGADPLPANYGQEKGYDGRGNPHQLVPSEPRAPKRRSDLRGGSRERTHPTGRTEPGTPVDHAENRVRMAPGTLPEGAALVAARAEKKKGPMVNTISPPEPVPDEILYSSGSESEEEEGGRQPLGKTAPPENGI
jgi:hypothetical protein